MSRRLHLTLIAALAASGALAGWHQAPSPADRFTVRDEMIPMRDGVRLHTRDLHAEGPARPAADSCSAHAVRHRRRGRHASTRSYKELADDGYIFVFQDIRGRFRSEGTFVMQRPARDAERRARPSTKAPTPTTRSTGCSRTCRSNNGRVGMLGISYAGWLTVMGALEPHPALKAVSPQASPADMWLGDDFHHNGAFRLSYGFEYAAMMESGEGRAAVRVRPLRHLRLVPRRSGPLANVNAKYLHGQDPDLERLRRAPRLRRVLEAADADSVPARASRCRRSTSPAGGTRRTSTARCAIYDALEQHDTQSTELPRRRAVEPRRLVAADGRDARRRSSSAARPSTYFREQVQAPCFAYCLKDKGTLDLPEALTFEAGANQWRRVGRLAAEATRRRTRSALLPGRSGELSFDAPADAGGRCAFDSYVSDPAHPVPYRQRPIQATYFPGGSKWSTWLVEDQRFVDDRARRAQLGDARRSTDDVTIAGEIVAHLFASTTGSDADWIVKLIDVYPGARSRRPGSWPGYQLMVANEVFRGRYRKSFEKPEADRAGRRCIDYTFNLHTQNYTFRKGHRIMVQVQSTWFPLIDRNPQTFVPNIFEAKSSDFRSATHRIYRSAQSPSHVVLPIVRPGS